MAIRILESEVCVRVCEQIDNHGNRFLLKEEASLNVPAIAAAHVIKRYTAQASDELSIKVNNEAHD